MASWEGVPLQYILVISVSVIMTSVHVQRGIPAKIRDYYFFSFQMEYLIKIFFSFVREQHVSSKQNLFHLGQYVFYE